MKTFPFGSTKKIKCKWTGKRSFIHVTLAYLSKARLKTKPTAQRKELRSIGISQISLFAGLKNPYPKR